MLRLFQHHISLATLAELLADCLTSFLAVVLGTLTIVHFYGDAAMPGSFGTALRSGLGFALLIPLHCGLVGVYREGSERKTPRAKLGRALLGCLLGAPIAYQLAIKTMVDGTQAHQLMGFAAAYLLVGLLIVRGLLLTAWRGALVQQRVLIIGTGNEAHAVATDLKSRRLRSHAVIGFYPAGESVLPANDKRFNIFGQAQRIEDIVNQHDVNQIIVAVKEQRGGNVPMDQLLSARVQGIPVMDLATFYEQTTGEVPVDSLKASFLVYGRGFAQGPVRIVIKRLFDILSSGALILLTLPLMLLTMLAIRLESKGPIIYRQERVGLGGKGFMCLKFRSMRTDAEKDGVAVWASKNDSRITRVGAFIRKTRIDELPQLFSVLSGEMSMVGPRPERPTFVAQLKEKIPFYDVRHSVKPGLTGWAQVRYSYGASLEDALHKHQYDLYYVKNNSLFLDIMVLFETVSVVLFREGAH
ncbi:TIGR03013 family XrtA/PEP-CTERM system glycosyltransferase [Aquabacterium sp.]|jgi:sugar transferase (PEP-CTERM system associated)|uniref:TIGR03013 family XrtA/PEP-CTERM system glycosyltransferase n=1 Tax=Aquabacterium sp. TaxID=1872578 RepID=UPI0025C65D4D|nr:TIGR03013 family XrtA/PEP-CTERM system glycosyltransferase [Aquabacterium sp.]